MNLVNSARSAIRHPFARFPALRFQPHAGRRPTAARAWRMDRCYFYTRGSNGASAIFEKGAEAISPPWIICFVGRRVRQASRGPAILTFPLRQWSCDANQCSVCTTPTSSRGVLPTTNNSNCLSIDPQLHSRPRKPRLTTACQNSLLLNVIDECMPCPITWWTSWMVEFCQQGPAIISTLSFEQTQILKRRESVARRIVKLASLMTTAATAALGLFRNNDKGLILTSKD